jgi:molybdopterin converting factor small subunit
MPTFRIPTPLRPYCEGQSFVAVDGGTVGEALTSLTGQYPALQQHLYNGKELRSFVNIYLNKEDIRHGDGEATVVGEVDTLLIVPSIAGGVSTAIE